MTTLEGSHYHSHFTEKRKLRLKKKVFMSEEASFLKGQGIGIFKLSKNIRGVCPGKGQ